MVDILTTTTEIAQRFREQPLPLVWGYIRVSDESHEDNESPEVQRDAILAYCKARKLDKPTIVHEKATAGKPLFAVRLPGMKEDENPEVSPRPLFSLLASCLCDQRTGTLVVWKLDRLARLANEQEMLFALFERYRVTLGVAYEPESFIVDQASSSDPTRVLMRQILAIFAQYERQLIIMRMRMGVQMKMSKGGWAGGRKPFGYKIVANDLVVDSEEAEVVRLIYSLRARSCLSMQAVADFLLAHGHAGWYKGRVMRVLNNKLLYSGIYTDPTGTDHPRPDLKILDDTECIIDTDDTIKPIGLPEYDGP